MLRRFLILALALHPMVCFADEVSEKTLQEIAAIDYRGIGFSSNRQELMEAISEAKLNNNHIGSKKGIATYEVRGDIDNDCVLLRFFEDKLVEINFIYFPKRIASKGGKDVLATQAIEKYGVPTIKNGKTLFWAFPSIDRIVVVSYENKKWSEHIYHHTRRLEIPDYKDTSVDIDESWMKVTVGLRVPYKSTTPRKPITSTRAVSGSLVKAIEEIPEKVLGVILQESKQDHPQNLSTQDSVVSKQVRAYHKWKKDDRPRNIPPRVYKYLKAKIARNYPGDYSTQNYVMERQLSAYTKIADMSTPTGMAGSHYFRFKESARRKHPRDYSTQLYVLNRYIDKYLLYREAGTSGDVILRYMLRYQ